MSGMAEATPKPDMGRGPEIDVSDRERTSDQSERPVTVGREMFPIGYQRRRKAASVGDLDKDQCAIDLTIIVVRAFLPSGSPRGTLFRSVAGGRTNLLRAPPQLATSFSSSEAFDVAWYAWTWI